MARLALTSQQHHIVEAVDYTEIPEPLLVMKYFLLRSLDQQHVVKPITMLETIIFLE